MAAALAALCGCSTTTAPVDTGGFRFTVDFPQVEAALVPTGSQSVRFVIKTKGTQVVVGTTLATRSNPTVSVGGLPAGLECIIRASAYPTAEGSGIMQATVEVERTVGSGIQDVPFTMVSTVAQVSVSAPGPTVFVGGSSQLTATARNASNAIVIVGASAWRWTTSDAAVATVASNGVVTGVGAGTVTITATDTESGISGSALLHVTTTADQIAFHSNRSGSAQIYVMDADGSNLTRITSNTANDRGPVWSFAGDRMAFYSDRDGNWEIYTMAADGSAPVRITNDPADDFRPCWSPDGTRIAFYSNRSPDASWDIYVAHADGSGLTNLTANAADDQYPAWSPDSTRIAFASKRDGPLHIYVMSASGANPTRLTDTQYDDWAPSWSPDGTRIAFQRVYAAGAGYNWEVCTMNADGTSIVRLTDYPGDDKFPTWSRDGSRIVFTRDIDPGDGEDFEVFSMRATDGGDLRNLTGNASADERPNWCWAPQ